MTQQWCAPAAPGRVPTVSGGKRRCHSLCSRACNWPVSAVCQACERSLDQGSRDWNPRIGSWKPADMAVCLLSVCGPPALPWTDSGLRRLTQPQARPATSGLRPLAHPLHHPAHPTTHLCSRFITVHGVGPTSHVEVWGWGVWVWDMELRWSSPEAAAPRQRLLSLGRRAWHKLQLKGASKGDAWVLQECKRHTEESSCSGHLIDATQQIADLGTAWARSPALHWKKASKGQDHLTWRESARLLFSDLQDSVHENHSFCTSLLGVPLIMCS